MALTSHAALTAWSRIAPARAATLVALKLAHVVPAIATLMLVMAGLLLLAAVSSAVQHAKVPALELGDPLGAILLAVAVTLIEVRLIASTIFAGVSGSEAVAPDTVFAVAMIVLNGVVGLCLVMGGRRHTEQTFQLQGASSTLVVLGTLAVMALIVPNVSLVLWGVFAFVQTIRHRR